MFWNEILMRIIYGEIMFNFYKRMIVIGKLCFLLKENF